MVNKYSLRVVWRSHPRPSCFKGECNVEMSLIDNANQYYKVSLYEHNHTLQTIPWHSKEETQNTKSYNTGGRQLR